MLGPVHACSIGIRVCVSAWLRRAAATRAAISAWAAPTISAWAAPQHCLSISAGLHRSYYLSAGLHRGYYCLGMRGLQLLSRYVCTGCSYYLGICGPQLLSRHARAAATISARAAVQLSQHGLRRGYYLGVGCAAATISAYLRGPQLLSRHKRSVSERVGYYLRLYLPWLSFGYYVSAVPAKPTWQGRWRRRCGNATEARRDSTAHKCVALDAWTPRRLELDA